jgi:DNA gyrase subunit B
MSKKIYNESSITYFKTDLAKIRSKPNMYIGPTDGTGIFTILREVLDNANDEVKAGRNDLIEIWVIKNQLWVADKGVGIPVELHSKAKISTLTHVLTNLQSSGKMDGNAYTAAVGVHGVGVKASNALSKEFKVWTFREDQGGWHYTAFAKGKEISPVVKSKAPVLPNGEKPKKGTVICFTPDKGIFGKHTMPLDNLKAWCDINAYMNPKLKIILHTKKTTVYFYKDGIKSWLAKKLQELKAEAALPKPISHSSSTLDIVITWTNLEGSNVEYYTNTVRNVDGGVHTNAFHAALYDSLKPYMTKKTEFSTADIREGLLGIVNVKINAPKFASQTKEKLVDERVAKPCYNECLQVLSAYFKANKTEATNLCKRAAEIRALTQSFKASKKLVAAVNKASKKQSTKLADIVGNSPIEDREILIVEGDSAGGTAKMARDKKHQAVLSLKGKPLNVMEAQADKINNNQEIVDIFSAIGFDLENIKSIRYGKIIFLCDPDVDGRHINCLLLTLFWRFAPDLFKAGKVFIIRSPEYLAQYKGKTFYGFTAQQVIKQVGTSKVKIDHLKGYGECSIEELKHIAINKDTRKLFKIMPAKDKASAKKFEMLMGKDSSFRKEILGVV